MCIVMGSGGTLASGNSGYARARGSLNGHLCGISSISNSDTDLGNNGGILGSSGVLITSFLSSTSMTLPYGCMAPQPRGRLDDRHQPRGKGQSQAEHHVNSARAR
jgi:hypothetical protein